MGKNLYEQPRDRNKWQKTDVVHKTPSKGQESREMRLARLKGRAPKKQHIQDPEQTDKEGRARGQIVERN